MSLRQDIYCAAHVLIAVYGEEAGIDAALQIAFAIDDLVAGERLHWGTRQ